MAKAAAKAANGKNRKAAVESLNIVCSTCGAGQAGDPGDGSEPEHPGVHVRQRAGVPFKCLAPPGARLDGPCPFMTPLVLLAVALLAALAGLMFVAPTEASGLLGLAAVAAGPQLVQRNGYKGLATIKRNLGVVALSGGQNNIVLDLPRDYMYARLMLRLRGTITISGGATSGTLHDDNPMSLLTRIAIEGTGGPGSVTLKDYGGIHAFRANHLLVGIEPHAAPLVGAGVQTDTAFSCIIPVDFALPGANIPPEIAVKSVLDPSEWGKLTLKVDVGTIAAFVNGGDRTNTLNAAGLAIDVTAVQAINVVPSPTHRAWRYYETFLFRDAPSAIATERRPSNALPVGRPYRYIMIRTTNEAGNVRRPLDDTLGDVKIRLGATEIYRYSSNLEYADVNRRMNKVRDAVNPSGLNALSDRGNPAIGVYMFDFAEDGRIDGIVNATHFGQTGTTLDFLHDIDTASARQVDFVAGFLVQGGRR